MSGDGPQLVTEEWKKRETAVRAAGIWALVLTEMLAGPPTRYETRVVGVHTPDWGNEPKVCGTVVLNDAPGRQRHVPFEVLLKTAVYEKGKGSVTTGNCHQLPGAGPETTGEYRTADNTHGTNNLSQHFEITVEESESESQSLSESVELSNETTVEAGVDFGAGSGSVSDTISETFGIDSSQTEDHSKSTSRTLSFDETIEPGQKIVDVLTLDGSVMECEIHVNAQLDWGDIEFTFYAPTYGSNHPHWSFYKTWTGTYGNLQQLWGQTLFSFDDDKARVSFKAADDIYRAAMGYDVRAPSIKMRFGAQARHALTQMAGPEMRWVVYDGVRRTSTKADASYKSIDATGVDDQMIHDTFGKAEIKMTDIDPDGDGRPDRWPPPPSAC